MCNDDEQTASGWAKRLRQTPSRASRKRMERSVRRLLSYQHDSDADVAHAERSWRRLSVKRDACGDLASGIRLVIILAAYKHGWGAAHHG